MVDWLGRLMAEHLATTTTHPTGDMQCDECGRLVLEPHFHLGAPGTHWDYDLKAFVDNEVGPRHSFEFDPPPHGTCDLPPWGWFCNLEAGHEGPCPTWPDYTPPERVYSIAEYRAITAAELPKPPPTIPEPAVPHDYVKKGFGG